MVVNQAEYKKANNKRENNVRVGLAVLAVGFAVGSGLSARQTNDIKKQYKMDV